MILYAGDQRELITKPFVQSNLPIESVAHSKQCMLTVAPYRIVINMLEWKYNA